jgi:hypothetical protein
MSSASCSRTLPPGLAPPLPISTEAEWAWQLVSYSCGGSNNDSFVVHPCRLRCCISQLDSKPVFVIWNPVSHTSVLLSMSLGPPFSEMPIRPVQDVWDEWGRFLCLQRCVVLHMRQSWSHRTAWSLLPTHSDLHSRCAIIAVLASNRWLFGWVIGRTLHLMLELKCMRYSVFKKLVYYRSLKPYTYKCPWEVFREAARACGNVG